MTGVSKYLNDGELKAKEILEQIGWCPQRTRFFSYESSYGIPDFDLFEIKHVEINKWVSTHLWVTFIT